MEPQPQPGRRLECPPARRVAPRHADLAVGRALVQPSHVGLGLAGPFGAVQCRPLCPLRRGQPVGRRLCRSAGGWARGHPGQPSAAPTQRRGAHRLGRAGPRGLAAPQPPGAQPRSERLGQPEPDGGARLQPFGHPLFPARRRRALAAHRPVCRHPLGALGLPRAGRMERAALRGRFVAAALQLRARP